MSDYKGTQLIDASLASGTGSGQADGSSSEMLISNPDSSHIFLCHAFGTWGGTPATLTPQISLDGGTTWITAPLPGVITAATALQADGLLLFQAPLGSKMRVTISTVHVDTEIDAWVGRVNT